jgi:hypothetical protein
MNKTIAWVVAIIIVAGGIWYFASHRTAVAPENNNSTSTLSGSSSTYENQYIKIQLASGWTAQSASSANHEGAVNITKGNYILYISPNATQASGVTGGRFAEIAMGSPSADLVIKSWPANPCGTNDKVTVDSTYFRVDEYISKSVTDQNCNKPTATSTLWYFGYLTTSKGGYFNYYSNQTSTSSPPRALVTTMSYQASDINSLPPKGSSDLNQALADIDSMLKTLQIKSHL